MKLYNVASFVYLKISGIEFSPEASHIRPEQTCWHIQARFYFVTAYGLVRFPRKDKRRLYLFQMVLIALRHIVRL